MNHRYAAISRLTRVFIKRALSALFGVLCLLLGLTSTMVAVLLMFAGGDDAGTPSSSFMFTLVKFLFCEIFVAFGIAATLVGLRYIFNRSDWFVSIVDRYWRKAVKYAMLLPLVTIGLGIVIQLIDLLV